jgi:hypothetical protein
MAGEQGGLRSAAAVSRVSFEPLSEFRENGGLSRDGSGLSMESASCEYENWRVRPPAAARPPPACRPPATSGRLLAVWQRGLLSWSSVAPIGCEGSGS